ncbi:MAG TPA: hypothetical protein VN539_03895 [Candidatus Saccharimonadales bacterium]|nr:hypothetical protein [Candidatus Saccharimonadales bacterium]
MAPTSDLKRASVIAFDRLDSLTDPDALSKLLGPIANVRREPLAGSSSGFSNSRHEILHVERPDGAALRLRLKRTHIGEDWISRLMRDAPPGREVSLLAEPRLAAAWDAFVRPHRAYAVEGNQAGLLMDDYEGLLLPDVREPIALATEDRLLAAIADLHARFWESEALSLPWLMRPEWYADVLGPHQAGDEAALRGAPQSIRDGVREGWSDAGKALPAEVLARLSLPAERVWRDWADLPRTLLHGDTKVANFAFLPDGRVAAFDWTNLGAAPATLEIGWYLAVNGTRLARSKDDLILRYRELLMSRLGRALDPALWDRMMDAAVFTGARMLLWSKALGLREGTPHRREDWAWWVERLTRWCAR